MITQSNYIPWKGYFDSMALIDVFVLYDEVQYTRRDWRNRNLIKTPQGLQWLSIPIEVKGKYYQKIQETRISEKKWVDTHLKTIRHNYAKAAAFKEVFPFIESTYSQARELDYLSEINRLLLEEIARFFGIHTLFHYSWEFSRQSTDRNRRLLEICQLIGATDYYTGPAAQAYIDIHLFQQAGIRVHWLDYNDYPEYPQLYPPFEHKVSIIDLLLNTGREAPKYLKHVVYAKA
jgi:hypothetical protein